MLLQNRFEPIVLPSQPGIPLDIVMQYRPNMFQDFFNVNLYFIGGTTVWFQDFSQLVQNSFKVAFELLSDFFKKNVKVALLLQLCEKKVHFSFMGRKSKSLSNFVAFTQLRFYVTTFSKSVCYAL